MNTAKNKWSWDGNIYGVTFMLLNDRSLETFDISCKLINTFAVMLRKNKLDEITHLFLELTDKQKEGLLGALIDYDFIPGCGFGYFSNNLPIECGNPIDLAKQFKFKEIEAFLSEQKLRLSSEVTEQSDYRRETVRRPL